MKKNLKILGLVVLGLWLAVAVQGYLYVWDRTEIAKTSWYDGSSYTTITQNPAWFESAFVTVVIAVAFTICWAVLVDDSHYSDEDELGDKTT